jgi:hypothetical protein
VRLDIFLITNNHTAPYLKKKKKDDKRWSFFSSEKSSTFSMAFTCYIKYSQTLGELYNIIFYFLYFQLRGPHQNIAATGGRQVEHRGGRMLLIEKKKGLNMATRVGHV